MLKKERTYISKKIEVLWEYFSIKENQALIQNCLTLVIIVVTAVTVYTSHKDTLKIFKQNDEAQHTQYRAYLSFESIVVEKNPFVRPIIFNHVLHYFYRNNGQTPAYNVNTQLTLREGKNEIGSSTNNIISLLAPNDRKEAHDLIPDYWLSQARVGSNKYIRLNIYYRDYRGYEHNHYIDSQLEYVATSTAIPVLFTYSESEN